MSKLTQQKQTRGRVKGTITRIGNSITQETTKSEAKVKLKKCETAWDNFEEIQAKIESTEISDDSAAAAFQEECEGERAIFEKIYFEVVTSLQTIIDEAEDLQRNVIAQEAAEINRGNQNQGAPVNYNRRRPKPPELKLLEFDGDFSKWLFFKNCFETTVHNDEKWTNVEKQQYLIGVLQGEAKKVIQGFTISEENYTSAWNLLVETYDNQMLIIETHLEELLKFPTIAKDNKSEGLRQLHFHIQTHIASLKAMRQPVQHWDTLIIHQAKKNLDFVEQKDWLERVKGCNPDQMPTLEEFLKFLIERSQSYMLLQQNKNKVLNIKTNSKDKRQGSKVAMTAAPSNCTLCENNHAIYNCEEFRNKSLDDKKKFLMEKGYCVNCLKLGHIARFCKGSKCKICGRLHNTLLHQDENSAKTQKEEESKATSANCIGFQNLSASFITNVKKSSQILLSTALIYIKNSQGQQFACRALMDPGSQLNFIRQDIYKKLNLPSIKKGIQISGIDRTRMESQKSTHIRLGSKDGQFETEAEFMILPFVTERLPQKKVNKSEVIIPKNVTLADPTFDKPGDIDVLLGAGLYWKTVIGEPKNSKNGQPVLQNTRFGWIIGGEIEEKHNELGICLKVTNIQVSEQIERFWKQETLPNIQHYTKEEKIYERHFTETISRDATGRFIVRLPIKPEVILGDSREQALKRLNSLWRILSKDSELRIAYVDFMNEYIRLGHMTLINEDEKQEAQKSYVITHHPVVHPDNDTTKVRVVFDGSAKTLYGPSLNDKLMTGPNLQRDLFLIILRFRCHEFVVTADVEKMFRQILVHPDDRAMQQILWKENPQAPVRTYKLNTVTYGTASAPYHAMRCLNELADLYKNEFPIAAKAIRDDFYMDDCLSGEDTLEDAICLRQQL